MYMFLKDLPHYPLEGNAVDKGQVNLRALAQVVREANDAILNIYNCENEDSWAVQFKSDKSPLTRADREAHDIIVKRLRGEDFPSCIGIVSEEDDKLRAAYDERKAWEYTWVVDPLDGTKEFIKRNGEFTVNIGLQHFGVAVGGVVSIPVKNVCYIGFKGLGAWKFNFGEEKLEKIACQTFKWNDPNLIVMGSRSHGSSLIDSLLKTLSPDYELRVSGSSLKMLAVADGTAHLYPRFGPCCEWDTCAAHAIVKEAGGEIYKLLERTEGGGQYYVDSTPLEYNKENLLNPFFLCIGTLNDDKLAGLSALEFINAPSTTQDLSSTK